MKTHNAFSFIILFILYSIFPANTQAATPETAAATLNIPATLNTMNTLDILDTAIDPVNYNIPAHWMNCPNNPRQPVDVFYLYPTAWLPLPGDGIICEIDNPSMLQGAKGSYSATATAFESFANVYAPYYRQADALKTFTMSPAEQEALLRNNGPAIDAIAAFDFYIKTLNNGRPFFLAGHSQGSNVLLYLMDTYLTQHPDVRERMIAAYLVGYSVTRDYLDANPHLAFAQGPDDTGVIISWNTEGENVTEPNPVLLPGALVINPLTWTTGTEKAGVEQNLGSLAIRNRQIVRNWKGTVLTRKGIASAQIDPVRGVLICDSVDPEMYSSPPPFPAGVYHGYDYPFYFENIRQNAILRSSVYLERFKREQ